MFPMQNFEPKSAVISVSSNSALIEKYLRNTCLGQGAVLTPESSRSAAKFAGLLPNLAGLLQISASLHKDGRVHCWVSGSATEFQRVHLKVGGSAGG